MKIWKVNVAGSRFQGRDLVYKLQCFQFYDATQCDFPAPGWNGMVHRRVLVASVANYSDISAAVSNSC
jgi:hypothetical protein